MNNLDTANAQQLEYANPLLHITVLGGIRLEGLDRLRVTLKISPSPLTPGGETTSLAIRHNLDLYNDTQVEKLVRKAAAKLETGTSVLEASLNELTELLEAYRLQQLALQDTAPETKTLTEAETQEALTFLQSEKLLESTNALIGQSGIIGEEVNRLIMYLVFSSRKRRQPLHVISLGSSGTGKTHLQEGIARFIPEAEKVEITTLSANAFYYFGQQELRHKLILIEDLDGAEGALYPIRELQSKKKISKTVAYKNTRGETKSQNITVEGPVCVAGCTTKESLYEDNANRSFLLYLDEGPGQDANILAYQRKASAGLVDTTAQLHALHCLQNSQYILQDIKVVNPYAEYLQLPPGVLKPRRTNAHYLHFIELVTWYHQHQREKKYDKATGEEYIETTPGDIQAANGLLQEVLLRKSDLLTGRCRDMLEAFKAHLGATGGTFTNGEVRKALRVSKSTAQRYLGQWQDAGAITRVYDRESQTHYYSLAEEKSYGALSAETARALEEALAAIARRTTAPQPDHCKGEPVKTLKKKQKA